ncbi:hypothetical protein [Buchananella felis]|uniref:hypothetical protein n=1 Tax=Buchananella felis TaxID=3231492 RepID=UPI003527E978
MSDDRLDENTPATPWFMRQVSEERGEGEHRPSFPAWLQQEDDDSAAADVAALAHGMDDAAPDATFVPAAVDDVAADPAEQEPGEVPADETSEDGAEPAEDAYAVEAAEEDEVPLVEPEAAEDEPVAAEPFVLDDAAVAEPQPEADSVVSYAEQVDSGPAADAEAFAAGDGQGDEDAAAAVEAAEAAPRAEGAADFAQQVQAQDEPQVEADLEDVEPQEDFAPAAEADFAEVPVVAEEAPVDAEEAAEQWHADAAAEDAQAALSEPAELPAQPESIDTEPSPLAAAEDGAVEEAAHAEAAPEEAPFEPVAGEGEDVAAAAVAESLTSTEPEAEPQPEPEAEPEAELETAPPADVAPTLEAEPQPEPEAGEALPALPALAGTESPAEDAADAELADQFAPEAAPAPEQTPEAAPEAEAVGTALPPLPSRRSRRHASWLDALEDEKRQEELAEQELTAPEQLAPEPVDGPDAPGAAEMDQPVADVSPLSPTEFEQAAAPGFAHIDAAAPTPQGVAAPADGAEADGAEVDTTAVRRYSLLAAVGAAPAAASAWAPSQAGEEGDAPLSDGSYRAAPAEAVLGMPVAEEPAPAPALEPQAAAPAEPDWREALQATRADTGEAAATAAGAEEAGPAWNPLTESDTVTASAVAEQKDTGEAALLEGASIKPAPISRAAAHWWSVFFTLLLVPIGWFLVTDATAQLMGAQLLEQGREVSLVAPPVWAMTELVLGGIAVALAVFVARWSSVGSILLGSILAAVGGLFAFAPQQVTQWFGPLLNDFLVYNAATQRFVLSFLADAVSGRILLGGVVLIFLGVVSHGARRQGRREQANYDLVGRRKRRKK